MLFAAVLPTLSNYGDDCKKGEKIGYSKIEGKVLYLLNKHTLEQTRIGEEQELAAKYFDFRHDHNDTD